MVTRGTFRRYAPQYPCSDDVALFSVHCPDERVHLYPCGCGIQPGLKRPAILVDCYTSPAPRPYAARVDI